MWSVYYVDGLWGFEVTCRNTGYKEKRWGFYSQSSAIFAANYFEFSIPIEERREKCRTMAQNS
jgi:hypothetical protein